MSKSPARIVALVALVVGLQAAGVAPAQAIQASGSIVLSPSKQLQLAQNEEFEVAVSFINNSSQTPVPPGPAAPATLTGPLTIDLGCTDCGCSQKQAGALSFVAGASAGCVTKAAGVTACSGNDSVVTIDLAAGGIALPADDTPVPLATIRLRMNAGSGPPLGIRAGTGVCALTACIAQPSQGCVSCAAEGCTFVTPTAPGNAPCDCPHACPSKIRFMGDLARPDFFELHGIITTAPGFDPVANPFTVTLSNSGGQIFSFTLPAGALVQQGSGVFQFVDGNAIATGGIARVRLGARDGAPGAFRIDITGYSAALEPATTVPTDDGNLLATWDVGGESFSTGLQSWERRLFGWQLNQFGICQL